MSEDDLSHVGGGIRDGPLDIALFSDFIICVTIFCRGWKGSPPRGLLGS